MELGSQRVITQGVSIPKPLPPFSKLTCNIYSKTVTPHRHTDSTLWRGIGDSTCHPSSLLSLWFWNSTCNLSSIHRVRRGTFHIKRLATFTSTRCQLPGEALLPIICRERERDMYTKIYQGCVPWRVGVRRWRRPRAGTSRKAATRKLRRPWRRRSGALQVTIKHWLVLDPALCSSNVCSCLRLLATTLSQLPERDVPCTYSSRSQHPE